MKYELWSKKSYDPPIEAMKLREGEIDCIPNKAVLIEPWNGWAGMPIKEMFLDLDTNILLIQIAPDYTGEYAAKVGEDNG